MPVEQAVEASGRPLALRRPRWFTHARYVMLLGLAFSFFSSVRWVSYLPTLWAIHASGDSSQHSMWTWATWFGANATMAAWLHEQNGRRCNAAVVVSSVNAAMCGATLLMVAVYRFL